jgi:Glutaminase
MRHENAIVATQIDIEAPTEEGGDVMVVLDGERRVRLDAQNPRSAGLRIVLEQLREQRRPVYVEVDPDSGAIGRILIPLATRVVGLVERGDELLLEVVASHAIHRLDLRDDDAAQLAEVLRRALDSGGGVILTEDESHRVIDVLEYTPAPDGPELPPFPGPPAIKATMRQPPIWIRLWSLFWWWFRCPSARTAQEIFDQLAATTCPPLTVPAPCIPFMYPDDGCWARAHEMCRLMTNRGRSPRKVWIYRSQTSVLHVNTRNSPTCYVEWGWHVAPTLCVRASAWYWPFPTSRLVMDPSMFTGPVPLTSWHAAQNDPAASLVHSGPEQYWPSGGTDPTYSSTNTDLAHYRTNLLSRSLQLGPPPYANCP